MEEGRETIAEEGWTKVGPADPNEVIQPIVSLKYRNWDAFQERFFQISDPSHPDYANWFTPEELIGLIAPTSKSVKKVTLWLESHGIAVESVTKFRNLVMTRGTVRAWSAALNTRFNLWRHESGHQLVKGESYTLPAHIAEEVDLIVGILGLPRMYDPKRILATSPEAMTPITPTDLRNRYNVTDVGTNSSNTMAVAEFQQQYYSPSDLTKFWSLWGPNNNDDKVARVIGNNVPSEPGIEADLDIQYIMAVAPAVPAWFIIVPPFDFWTDLTRWVGILQNTSGIPPVHSVSYGDQNEDQPTASYKFTLSNHMMTLGSMGMSIIFASGDSGTGCFSCSKFQPSFPATIPYVTSVGATKFISGTSGPEEATTYFPSGGGFSNHFSLPDWQAQAVHNYLQNTPNLPPASFYNSSGRGTPDVAAMGEGFQIIYQGQSEIVAGTSCAAPTFSAIVALLNQVRVAQGKSTLGWLNPWLYQVATSNPNAFFDVTEGENASGCCHKGFPATKGWDPVTGLGTPNYKVLKTLV